MTSANRAALAQASLDRVADQKGDITQIVLERYYATMPDARASFARHGLDDVAGLEARMVAETIFLLLKWTEDRSGTMIDQGSTIVHHNDALEIGPRWYLGLVDAVLEIIDETIPPGCPEERTVWSDVRDEIGQFVESLRREFIRTIDPSPTS